MVVVLGIVVATVARSCWTTVIIADALVTVSVSVRVRVRVLVVVVVVMAVDGFRLLSVGALGVGGDFVGGKALRVDMSLASPVMLDGAISLPVPGMLGDGMFFPAAAGILGAAVSFPAPLFFPFLGDRADPRDPRTERGKSLMVADL